MDKLSYLDGATDFAQMIGDRLDESIDTKYIDADDSIEKIVKLAKDNKVIEIRLLIGELLEEFISINEGNNDE